MQLRSCVGEQLDAAMEHKAYARKQICLAKGRIIHLQLSVSSILTKKDLTVKPTLKGCIKRCLHCNCLLKNSKHISKFSFDINSLRPYGLSYDAVKYSQQYIMQVLLDDLQL